MRTQRVESLKPALAEFIGTTAYYKHFIPGFKFTDGVHYLAETYNCYWLIDVALSHAMELYQKHGGPEAEQNRLLCGKLTVNDDDTALFVMDDGNGNVLARQKIPFTDFPAKEQTIWVQNFVAMLPSEY